MTITRPYDAENNDFNLAMDDILGHWAERHGEVISVKEIYTSAVKIRTESGREVMATKAEGSGSSHYNVRNYIYLKEKVGGKSVRIKKEEW